MNITEQNIMTTLSVQTTMFEGYRSFVSVGCLLWNQHKKGKEKKKKKAKKVVKR